ncbi:MAG TPA: sialidase family protein [Flavobacteriales bacterium]|nr:sialidase family protein [Flavobacteriales bacterium]
MRSIRTAPFAFLALLSLDGAAQWSALGSAQQQTRSMTSEGGALYAVTFPTGVKKSTNGGSTWTPVNTGLPQNGGNYFVESVGRKGTSLFAGTQSGIFRSDNGGTSWSSVNGSLTATNQVFANKFFSFGNDLFAVFAGTVSQGGGIWKTDNLGTTWNVGHSGMGSNTIVYHLSQVGGLLYAATNTGIYTSANNGLNWTAMPGVNYTVFGVAAAGSNLVMLSTFGVRYSTNNGTTWTDATGTPTSLADGEIIGYDAKVYVIVPNQTGIYRSLDNGASFTPYNGGVAVIDLVSLEEFFADGSLLYVGSFTDIYSTAGSTVSVAEPAAAPSAYLYPTVFESGFTAVMPEGQAQVSLVLFDAQGREALRVDGLGAGEHRIERGALKAGTYRCVVEGADGARRGRVGTVIAR